MARSSSSARMESANGEISVSSSPIYSIWSIANRIDAVKYSVWSQFTAWVGEARNSIYPGGRCDGAGEGRRREGRAHQGPTKGPPRAHQGPTKGPPSTNEFKNCNRPP